MTSAIPAAETDYEQTYDIPLDKTTVRTELTVAYGRVWSFLTYSYQKTKDFSEYLLSTMALIYENTQSLMQYSFYQIEAITSYTTQKINQLMGWGTNLDNSLDQDLSFDQMIQRIRASQNIIEAMLETPYESLEELKQDYKKNSVELFNALKEMQIEKLPMEKQKELVQEAVRSLGPSRTDFIIEIFKEKLSENGVSELLQPNIATYAYQASIENIPVQLNQYPHSYLQVLLSSCEKGHHFEKLSSSNLSSTERDELTRQAVEYGLMVLNNLKKIAVDLTQEFDNSPVQAIHSFLFSLSLSEGINTKAASKAQEAQAKRNIAYIFYKNIIEKLLVIPEGASEVTSSISDEILNKSSLIHTLIEAALSQNSTEKLCSTFSNNIKTKKIVTEIADTLIGLVANK